MIDRRLFHALGNEAALAAEHLAIGVTALGKANYAEPAHYYQAFFSLSLGIERTCKLALIADHALANGGQFPDEQSVRKYGHDLKSLLGRAAEVAQRRNAEFTLPDGQVHREMVRILTKFATNVTRYYNLDLAAGKAASELDPVADWHRNVITVCWQEFVPARQKQVVYDNADFVGEMLGESTFVMFHTEEGEDLLDLTQASARTGIGRRAAPWVRLHVLQICRFLAGVMRAISYASYELKVELPIFSDFYRKFENPDSYLKGRKTWSIHEGR